MAAKSKSPKTEVTSGAVQLNSGRDVLDLLDFTKGPRAPYIYRIYIGSEVLSASVHARPQGRLRHQHLRIPGPDLCVTLSTTSTGAGG